MSYSTEFKDFILPDDCDFSLLNAKFEDESWHNNAMPCFIYKNIAIWIDYPKEQSEHADLDDEYWSRYGVQLLDEDGQILDCDNLAGFNHWDDVVLVVNEMTKRLD